MRNFLIYYKITTLFKNILKFLKKHNVLLQIFVNSSMLIISIVAIKIAVKSYKSVNQQFFENSIKSDSIFKIQLANEQKINTNLEKIQKLTNEQIEIINQQLVVSTQTFKDQINSGCPKLIFLGIELSDSNKIIDNKFAPSIYTHLKNTGKRFAYDVAWRAFIVSKDYHLGSSSDLSPKTSVYVGPDEEGGFQYMPKIEKAFSFYYCFEIYYTDKLTNKIFYHTYVLEYNKIRGIGIFIECDQQKKIKVKSVINNLLKEYKQPLLRDN